MLEYFFKSVKDIEFQKIDRPRVGSWIHVSDASVQDIEEISKLTSIGLTELSDSLDKYEIPRIEQIGTTIIVFTRHPAEADLGLHTITLAIILTENYVITISPDQSDLIEQILSNNVEIATTQKSKFFFHVLLNQALFG